MVVASSHQILDRCRLISTTQTYTHTINVYIHQNLNCYTVVQFIFKVRHKCLCQISVMYHTLSGIPLICHLAFQIMVHRERETSKLFDYWGSTASVEIRLTGKRPRCYVLDSEYAEG